MGKKKVQVCLCWTGCYTLCTHRRDLTTAHRGHFELLDFSPGPIRIASDNLVLPGSPRGAILTPGLVRTPVQHDTACSRTPDLKPSTEPSLPVTWITGPVTDPS